MTASRRKFIQQSLTAGALLPFGLAACSGTGSSSRASSDVGNSGAPRKQQRILILGGTGFLGPALIDAVLARGHKLTLFNSGRTENRRVAAGRDSVVPEGVEVLIGNRDPLLTADDRRLRGDPDIESKRDPNSPRGLSQLEGREWDAVIDTSGYFPRMVAASAEFLAPNVGQYMFVSSISVYSSTSVPGADETAELLGLDDPTTEEFGEQFENYGGGKALCEQAAEAALPGRTTNVRPGYIVGPRDTSRRWSFWPWRAAQGGEMAVPGKPEDPIQIIDVRDLAEWMVLCCEQRIMGEFNATGPASELSMRRMLEGCRAAAGSDVRFTWADAEFLAERELNFPIWLAPEGETAGFHRVSVERAMASGLTFRTIEDTARATLDWLGSLPEDLATRVMMPFDLEQEAAALEAWRAAATG